VCSDITRSAPAASAIFASASVEAWNDSASRGRDRVVEPRAAVGVQRDRAAVVAGQQAVHRERDERAGVRQAGHQLVQHAAEAVERHRGEQGLQRRGLDEEAVPVGPAVDELVRPHRLRRAVVGLHGLGEVGHEAHHRVQEGAPADPPAEARAQQQRRTVDRAARRDRHLGQHAHPRPVGRARAGGHHAARHRHHPPAFDLQPLGAHVGVQRHPGGERVGDVGDAHRLLAVDRTAEAAVAAVGAAVHVAPQRADLPAELAAAVEDDPVVPVRQRLGPRRDVQALLHRLEVGGERGLVEALDPVLALPVIQDGGGRAEAGGPVDRGRPADAAALEHGEGQVGRRPRAALLVQRGHRVGLMQREVAPRDPAPLLDHHDVEARLRQPGREHSAAGARAHDAHVAAPLDVGCDVGVGEDLPAHPPTPLKSGGPG
jgi:hypothetical protein